MVVRGLDLLYHRAMSVLELQKTIIYGPIASRRLGPSLGINLSSTTANVCSFDCVYCQYGPTTRHLASAAGAEDMFPSCDEVAEALAAALPGIDPPGYLTFSGNGEPTLHPEFPAIVEAVRDVRDRLCPEAKVAVLSNSSMVGEERTRAALARVDLPIMKLDVGSAAAFEAINVPAPGVKFEDIVAGLEAMKHFVAQSCFVADNPGNADDGAVADYVRIVGIVRPAAVQIYTTDRPVARAGVRMVPRERLAGIARRVCEEAGIPAEIY
ncbi:MAG: radical SAM protein [Candidatus Coatesbacteria bacterium]|nr:MAG: radical SAM protein [Candidatus Coatesbacteria bacterium]